jgi:chromosome segregation ATPase
MKMTIFGRTKELETKVTELQGNFDSTSTLLTEATTYIAQLEQTNKELLASANGVDKEIYEKLVAEKAELATQVETLQAEVTTAGEAITEFDQRVADAAADIVANSGSPLVSVTPEENPMNMSNSKRNSRYSVNSL